MINKSSVTDEVTIFNDVCNIKHILKDNDSVYDRSIPFQNKVYLFSLIYCFFKGTAGIRDTKEGPTAKTEHNTGKQ